MDPYTDPAYARSRTTLKVSPMDAVETTTTPSDQDVLPAPAVDATLPAGEWDCVLALRRGGVTDGGLYRLLRLRTRYRQQTQPATDGLEADPRAQFARWLVPQGRLHEGE